MGRERNLLSTLMDNIPDFIYFKDAKSRFVRTNRAHAKAFGLSDPDEAVGKTDFDFFTKEHAWSAYEDEQRIIQTGQPIVGQVEKETWPDRPDTWVSTTKMPVRDEKGDVVGTFGISRDVTESKRAEETLARERSLLRTLIDVIPDYVFVKDAESHFVLDNTAHLHVLGVKSQEELIGKTDLDIFPEELARIYYVDEQQVMQSGIPLIDREESVTDSTGKTQWLLTTKVPFRDAAGKTVGLVGISHDITGMKEADEQIRRRADEFAGLDETANDLATVRELPKLLQTIVERAVALLHAASGSIFLLDASRQDLEIVVAEGTELPVGTRFKLGEGMTGRVAETHEPLVVEDYRTWEYRSPQMGDIPLTASAAVPMLFGGELIGVLIVNEAGDTPAPVLQRGRTPALALRQPGPWAQCTNAPVAETTQRERVRRALRDPKRPLCAAGAICQDASDRRACGLNVQHSVALPILTTRSGATSSSWWRRGSPATRARSAVGRRDGRARWRRRTSR